MSVLQSQLESKLLPGMTLPPEFSALYRWIESKGMYVENDYGRIGFLFPEDQLNNGWTDTERPGGTNVEFGAAGNLNTHYWFGHRRPEVLNRVCVFARTGAEGSEAVFWIDDQGQQRIVHMGSGSGSVLCCVLADSAIDFLRLIAIGYDEICWNSEFAHPPNSPELDSDFFVHPNEEYQRWLVESFGVSVPKTALEVVKHPAEMGDSDTSDEFCLWVNANTA
ncbi:MAG: SMI1/KNR4 family protein [Planctomycetota bacterium]